MKFHPDQSVLRKSVPRRSVLRSTAFIFSAGVAAAVFTTARAFAAPVAANTPPTPPAAAASGAPPLEPSVTPVATTQMPDSPPTEVEPAETEPPAAGGPISYVQQLGAEAYPDRTRGLYGGSLWLEPSFHGLQWPYMPRTGLGLSGSAWVDTGYLTIDRGLINSADTKEWVQQARAVLRATPTYAAGRFFIQGQAELVANKDQVRSQSSANSGIVDVDDLWLRVGAWDRWDVKVGRFEAWELYHTGMGLDINTIERRGATQTPFGGDFERPDYYGVTYLHDRPSEQGVGNIALHVYPTDFLRFELLGQIGANVISDIGTNTLGGRPAAILDLGWLKVKFGAEYKKTTPADTITVPLLDSSGAMVLDASGNPIQIKEISQAQTTQRGVGGTVQVVFPFIEGGVNYGVGLGDAKNDKGTPDPVAATTTKSIGAFVNVSVSHFLPPRFRDTLLVGGGVNWTTQTDLNADSTGKTDYTANLQTFGAIQYLVARQLFVKVVLAYARSDFDLSFGAGQFSDYMYSARVRLMYLF